MTARNTLNIGVFNIKAFLQLYQHHAVNLSDKARCVNQCSFRQGSL